MVFSCKDVGGLFVGCVCVDTHNIVIRGEQVGHLCGGGLGWGCITLLGGLAGFGVGIAFQCFLILYHRILVNQEIWSGGRLKVQEVDSKVRKRGVLCFRGICYILKMEM